MDSGRERCSHESDSGTLYFSSVTDQSLRSRAYGLDIKSDEAGRKVVRPLSDPRIGQGCGCRLKASTSGRVRTNHIDWSQQVAGNATGGAGSNTTRTPASTATLYDDRRVRLLTISAALTRSEMK